MANQMIALQARAPQSSGLGGAIQQNAQMINMMRQQEASDRANALAAQKLAQDQALMAPQLAEAKSKAFSAEQKALTDFFDVAAKVIGLSKSPEDVRFGADMLKKRFDNPLFAQMIDQTIKDMPDDPQAFGAWRNQTKLETLDAKDQVPYFFEQVKSKELIGETGDVGVLTTGGLGAPTIRVPKTLVPRERRGTATVEPSVTVEDNAPVNSAEVERFIQSFPKEAQAAIRQRVNEGALGNIPMGSPVAGGLVAGARGGVGGPYEAVDDGYVEAATPFRAKNPMQSPMPGSAIVPLPRVAAEKRVEAQAAKDVELAAETEKSKNDQRRAAQNFFKVSGVDLRTGKDPVADLIKKSTSGTLEALGAEFVGALPEQIGGGATAGSEAIGELETIAATITNNLLGGKLGTGISNEDRKMIERMVGDIGNPYIPASKRLASWNRVKKIQAAYLGETPAAAPAGRRTPVMQGIPPAAIEHLRKNPSLRGAFDAKYGAGKAAKILGGK